MDPVEISLVPLGTGEHIREGFLELADELHFEVVERADNDGRGCEGWRETGKNGTGKSSVGKKACPSFDSGSDCHLDERVFWRTLMKWMRRKENSDSSCIVIVRRGR